MMKTLTENIASPAIAAGEAYRYKRFSLRLMLRDLRFGSASLQPGDMPPDVTLTDLDGSGLGVLELLAAGPTVIVTGSVTCPMTSSSTPLINRLYDEFSPDINFVLLYVREAHPGELLRQPESLEEKAEHALRFRAQLGVEPRVVVDDLNGTLHRLLDAKPNAAFVFDAEGRLVFRALWASDESSLRKALLSIRDARPLAARQSTRMIAPHECEWKQGGGLRLRRAATSALT